MQCLCWSLKGAAYTGAWRQRHSGAWGKVSGLRGSSPKVSQASQRVRAGYCYVKATSRSHQRGGSLGLAFLMRKGGGKVSLRNQSSARSKSSIIIFFLSSSYFPFSGILEAPNTPHWRGLGEGCG